MPQFLFVKEDKVNEQKETVKKEETKDEQKNKVRKEKKQAEKKEKANKQDKKSEKIIEEIEKEKKQRKKMSKEYEKKANINIEILNTFKSTIKISSFIFIYPNIFNIQNAKITIAIITFLNIFLFAFFSYSFDIFLRCFFSFSIYTWIRIAICSNSNFMRSIYLSIIYR